MRNTILLLSFVITLTQIFAQVKSGTNARIAAYTALEEYGMNPAQKDRLEYAIENIRIAAQDEKTADDPSTWRAYGMIMTRAAADEQLQKKELRAGIEAFDAYEKSLSMEISRAEVKGKTADKIASKQEFIDGFSQTAIALFRQGGVAFDAKKSKEAFENYVRLVKIPVITQNMDTKKKISTSFENGKEVIDMLALAAYYGGISACRIDSLAQAEAIMMPALKEKKLKEDMMKSAFTVLSESYLKLKNYEKARSTVAEARKLYPTDNGLLITEINIALQEGRLAELEEQLTLAVNADPKNVTLHFVMGNMYDELFRSKVDYEKWPVSDENLKLGKEFFAKACIWYQKALDLDPKDFNSVYSLGAIHVNFSNYFATFKNKNDKLKKDELAAVDKEYFSYVDKGLSYLLKAEQLDPNDLALIRALKEVYTRKSDEANYMKYSSKEKELQKK